MALKMFAFVVIAVLSLPAYALAADPGCERHATECAMACCKDHHSPSAVDVLLSLGDGVTTADELATPPARQRAVVWFHRPVWVGRNVLMGKYLIEHDTDRQARGEPCTHIYAINDQQTPVVSFHCTHLDAETTDRDEVVLESLPDGMRKLLRFQFAGDNAAHGMPAR